jgi:hypothetical protein
MGGASKAFISYSHDSAMHKKSVCEFSNRLRNDGIDSNIDQYEMSPPEGWPTWMSNQIHNSDFVIVVCTETYLRRIEGKEKQGKGLGATWEGAIITQSLYEAQGINKKFIPVVFTTEDIKYIPSFLKPVTYYDLSFSDGYENLYRQLTSQPQIIKPKLGEVRQLIQKNEYISTTDKPAITHNEDYSSLVLLYFDGKLRVSPSEKIIYDSELKLLLTPKESTVKSFLSSLKTDRSKTISISFGNTALLARINSVVQERTGNKEIWTLFLDPEECDYGAGFMEMSVNNFTADEIAEMRARRILLNDTLSLLGLKKYNKFDWDFMEVFVRGQNTPIQVINSPFPELYSDLKGDIPYFLAVARLVGVLWLRLSGVVQDIFKLDFKMVNGEKMSVVFEGLRPRKYSNVEPTKIKVEGTCKLV